MSSPLPSYLALVLGGARSGKSRHAEDLCLQTGLEPIYVATAQVLDGEMAARVARHQADRDARWRSVEEPLALADCLWAHARPDRIVLVECLTLWLTNLMVAEHDVASACGGLVEALRGLPGPVVLVSNEVGHGIVPANAMARAFVDHAGRLHQQIAAIATTVTFVVAELPWVLKGQR